MERILIAGVPIEELISESWEGVLDRLTADMDPWNIDVAKLTKRYRDYINSLQDLQFAVTGRMVLTCSTLLRMKSDILARMGQSTDRNELIDELEDVVDEAAMQWEELVDPGPVSLPVRRKPRRQVTIGDLKSALDDAFSVTRRRVERFVEQTGSDEDQFDYLDVEQDDISNRLYSLFNKIRDFLASRTVLSFFRLLDSGDKEERIQRFVEILHLTSQQKIACNQEEFLGDILISLEQNS